jgi:hypothetical protein
VAQHVASSRSKVLSEKLITAQLILKFPATYGTQRLVIVFAWNPEHVASSYTADLSIDLPSLQDVQLKYHMYFLISCSADPLYFITLIISSEEYKCIHSALLCLQSYVVSARERRVKQQVTVLFNSFFKLRHEMEI